MKKFVLFFLASISLLQAAPVLSEAPQKPSFPYVTFGVATPLSHPNVMAKAATPDISFGWRKLNGESSWDARVGARYRGLFQSLLAQYSWLYVPGGFKGNYLGLGILGGVSHLGKLGSKGSIRPNFDFPVTLGYLFSGKTRTNFFQFQFYPLIFTTIRYLKKKTDFPKPPQKSTARSNTASGFSAFRAWIHFT